MNESSIVLQFIDLFKDTNVGSFTDKILLTFGGLASLTVIYFFVMFYLQSQINKSLKKQREDIDLLILLINEQHKRINSIHKVLILEDVEKNSGEAKQDFKEYNNLDNINLNYNNNSDGFFPMRVKK